MNMPNEEHNTTSLIITDCEKVSPVEWAIRFTGSRADFAALVSDLKAEGYKYARWDSDVFSGRSGWVVDDTTLILFYKDRFRNLQDKIEHALAREGQAQ